MNNFLLKIAPCVRQWEQKYGAAGQDANDHIIRHAG